MSPVPPAAALNGFLSGLPSPLRLMVAVSGGSDSLGLLFLLHAALAGGGFPGVTLCAATVDHGLRAESAGEALAVARFCQERGIAHRIAVWDGAKPVTGLAAAARAARYDLLCGMADAFQADAILTAHTADDQVETVTMRAARTDMQDGRGLAGMARAVLLHGRHWLLRPMLACRRGDIRAVLRAHGVGWIEDPSNGNADYERPRVRARLTAGEAPFDPALIAAAQRRRTALSNAVAAFVPSAVTVHGGSVIAVSREATAALDDDAVLSYALSMLAAVAGGQAHPLSADRIQPILGLCRSGEQTRLNAGRVLFDQRREALYLLRERRGMASCSIASGGAAIWDGRYRIGNGSAGAVEVTAAGPAGREQAEHLFASLPPGVAATAAAALPLVTMDGVRFPLVPGRAMAGVRIEHFLAPFDRFLPLFDLTLACNIAGMFGLDRYSYRFAAF